LSQGKNWLFSNSVDGAHTSARLFSLIETAKAHHLNPVAYLQYIFKELPICHTMADFEALLPFNLKDSSFLKISK
jgi:transposase